MKKFRFPLEMALELRARTVETAEQALRAAQEEWKANQRLQDELADEVRRAEHAAVTGNVDAAEMVALDRYRAASHRRRQRLAHEAAALVRRVAERQAAWQTAERDRTLLIRLKEKSLARWQLESEKEQQQLAEEAYLSRWGR